MGVKFLAPQEGTKFAVGAPVSFRGMIENIAASKVTVDTPSGDDLITIGESGVNPGDGTWHFKRRFNQAGKRILTARAINSQGDVVATDDFEILIQNPLVKSGAIWVSKFPGSRKVEDLASPFRGKVEKFIAALDAAHANRSISSTLRPPKRAFLMHWSWKIVKKHHNAQQVPVHPDIDIDWWHGSQEESEKKALEMVNGYGTGHSSVAPALSSRHIQGRAIDMSISWSGTLHIKSADGTTVHITSTPRTTINPDLMAVAATYGVIHFKPPADDKPHWSSDGK